MSRLYVVGLGPGGLEHMTPAARAAVETADVVAGYKTYLDLIPELVQGKRIVCSGMRKEVERCRLALEEAATGAQVALICSGDAGIYGMAGLAMELAGAEPQRFGAIEVEVVPGVSAVQAAAARLGAPLMHDFAVISLSDLLTSWELIRRRLQAAAQADFVVALYNPRSRGRTTQIVEARQILLQSRSGETPVGIVRNACREGETVTVTTLAAMLDHPIDMFTLVLIGNSATRVDPKGRMVTPRGYSVRSEQRGVGGEDPLPLTPHPSPPADEKAAALFVGGTGSDVGKSVVAAGLCRLLARRGYRVAPFKAQNMALNSAVTPEGGEIGRAQAMQAAACGLDPHTDMNPVLLKPNSDTGSQVIVQGRPVGNMTVTEYHAYKTTAFERVRDSFARLSASHEVIILEGAGSIAEINLKAHDITNLKAAALAGAPVLLVADIDRGGVFASILGTLELLDPSERAMVSGVVINRFRGDPALLAPGIEAIERRTGVPVIGVVPYLELQLPEEDSVALARKVPLAVGGSRLRIGVVRLPRLSNYTDFDPLERHPQVALEYLDAPERMVGLDLLILPGTKSTLADLDFLRRRGLDDAILHYHREGGRVVGICGGYQMLGHEVADPQGVEGSARSLPGLGLLDITTVMQAEKRTRQASGTFLPAAADCGLPEGEGVSGYEIHMGESRRGKQARPLLRLIRSGGEAQEVEDGAVSADGRVWGSYLHGLFDQAAGRNALLDLLRRQRRLPEEPLIAERSPSDLDRELDRLADHLESHLDVERVLGWLAPQRREAG